MDKPSWKVGDECVAKWHEDNLWYKAMVLEVTGVTYTVVFIEYGHHQPATPAEHIRVDDPKNSDDSEEEARTRAQTKLELDDLECLEGDGSQMKQPHLASLRPSRVNPSFNLDLLDEMIDDMAEKEERGDLNELSRSPQTKSILKKLSPKESTGNSSPSVVPTAPPTPSKETLHKTQEWSSETLKQQQPSSQENPEEEASSGPFFGIELTDLYARDGTAVPAVLKECAKELTKRSHEEGIFRVPGRAEVVAKMVEQADSGEPLEIFKHKTADIASFLKKFFALLPSAVIPSNLLEKFGQTRIERKTLCRELRLLIDQALPVERAEVLEFMLNLLHTISLKSEQNKMTGKNLATVFLPALFFSVQSDQTSPEELMKMAVLGKAVSATLAFMIDNPELDASKVVEESAQPLRATIAVKGSPTMPSKKKSTSRKISRRGSMKLKRGTARSSSSSSPNLVELDSKSSSAPSGSSGGFSGKTSRKGSRRSRSRSLSVAAMDAAADSPSGKVSAESVLAAMRKASDRIIRRAGTFVADGTTWMGKRGWLSMGKKRKRRWFLIVNDWLYWFAEENAKLSPSHPALGTALAKFEGNLWMARCNTAAGARPNSLEIIQPSGANFLLTADSALDRDEWMFSLTEVSIAGFPLPLDVTMPQKEEWVTLGKQNAYAVMEQGRLTLFKDEEGQKPIRQVELCRATVAKGKLKRGGAGFVVSDALGKLVIQTHNSGAAQEWVDIVKSGIIISWASKYEPESLRV